MNATPAGRVRAAWLAPWRATSRQSLWVSAAATVLFGLGAIGIGMATPGQTGVVLALASYALGIYFWWQFCMASLVILARDARLAGVPGVAKNTVASVALYATASIAAPVVVAAIFVHAAGFAALVSALVIASALALAFLPRITGVLIALLPTGYVGLHNLHAAPSPFDPRLQALGWAVVIALVLFDVLSWRRLLTGDGLEDNSRSGPLLAALRMQALRGRSTMTDLGWWARARKPRAARIRFRTIGPHAPVKAIRIGLSGWLAPQTTVGHAAQVGYLLLFVPFMMIPPLVGGLSDPRHLGLAWPLEVALGGAVLWLLLFAAFMVPLFTIGLLHQRWSRGSELALLALLPGLERDRPAARSVACAVLAAPLATSGLGGVAVVGIGMVVHAHPLAIVAGVLFFAGVALGTGWTALRTMGGRPLSTLASVAAIVIGSLGLAACIAAVAMATSHAAALVGAAQALVGLCALLCAAIAWHAGRAWLAFRRRPHPFLANSP